MQSPLQDFVFKIEINVLSHALCYAGYKYKDIGTGYSSMETSGVM